MTGRLSIVSTPIGNLGDITLRALDRLQEAHTIYAEDTRVTSKLLKHFEITTPVKRCDEHVMDAVIPFILEQVQTGECIAYVSDAGTPGVCDPGVRLVSAARKRQEDGIDFEIEVVPGASAVLTALVGSGIMSTAFYFGGFLPRKEGERTRLLESLAGLEAMLIFYESNHRTVDSLKTIARVFPGREVCAARELTKLFEEFMCSEAVDVAHRIALRTEELKGEVVLVIGPPIPVKVQDTNDLTSSDIASLATRGNVYRGEGLSRAKAAKRLAQEYGITRDAAYGLLEKSNDESDLS